MSVVRREHLLDAGLLLALGGIAFLGFAGTFVGWAYLPAGVLGLLLGMAIAYVGRGQPVVVLAVGVLAAFFLLGGAVALHGLGGWSFLPLPHTLATLADGSVNGWKRLLTTLPPVDEGSLLVVPYILGLVAGCLGLSLALRVRTPVAPVIVPIALLAGVILLGVPDPDATALLGAVFAALVVTWVVVRGHRARALSPGGRRTSRVLIGGGLCLGVAAVALGAGPHLPGLAPDRTVLRSEVRPPFDVGKYPSPLAGFRVYTKGYQSTDESRRLYAKPLFTVRGLPAGTRVRLAALDAYDGTVWRAADDSGVTDGAADTFQKVGSTLRNPLAEAAPRADDAAGAGRGRVTGTVTVGDDFGGVWMPLAGDLTHLVFHGKDATAEADGFRYNLATGTGVLPSALRPGDAYTFTSRIAQKDVTASSRPWSGTSSVSAETSRFQSLAADLAGNAGTPMEQVLAVAAKLKDTGTYTDGEPPNQQYTAGHSLRRLADFAATGGQLAGDDEQYAALMAILANQLGVPARVVMGAQVPADGIVRGQDVHAWVELRLADGSWGTLDWRTFMNTEKPPQQNAPTPEDLVTGKVVPPPAPVRPPSTSGDPLDSSVNQKARERPDDGFHLPGWLRAILVYAGLPVLVLAALGGLVVGLKAWRRHRRRTAGTPVARLAGGWREALDHALDHGHRAPRGATRSEQAAALAGHDGLDGAPALALATDRTMFAESAPSDADAAAYWEEVGGLRRSLTEARRRRDRVLAAVNPRTLLHR